MLLVVRIKTVSFRGNLVWEPRWRGQLPHVYNNITGQWPVLLKCTNPEQQAKFQNSWRGTTPHTAAHRRTPLTPPQLYRMSGTLLREVAKKLWKLLCTICLRPGTFSASDKHSHHWDTLPLQRECLDKLYIFVWNARFFVFVVLLKLHAFNTRMQYQFCTASDVKMLLIYIQLYAHQKLHLLKSKTALIPFHF